MAGDIVPPVNIALGRETWQSSIGWGGDPARAVDGNNNGVWGGSSCTHTVGAADPDPWWATDLGDSYEVTSVVVWNREGCCSKFNLLPFSIVVFYSIYFLIR